MRKAFVVIGANEYQDPLIIKAKEKGYETHVFAWEQGAVGRKDADYFYPVSIIEKDKILEECQKIHPVGIASIGSDLAMLTVNYVADRLGLPANSLECTSLSTNKYLMRKAFENGGDPSPRYALSGEVDRIDTFRYPLIVKPTDRSGSRGVTRVERTDEFKKAIEDASGYSFDHKAIVEEFIEGKEYSVEFISYQGQHHFLTMTEKFTTGAPHFIETGHHEPAQVSGEVLERVKQVVTHALNTLKVTTGASHSEVMINGSGEVTIVEIGARMGGDCIGSDLVYLSTGLDFVGMVVDISCGNEPDMSIKRDPRPVSIHFIFCPDDLAELDRIREHEPERLYTVSQIEPFDGHAVVDSSTRYGYYITFDD
jgi:biotin carboxylase